MPGPNMRACPRLIAYGSCDHDGCTYNHDVHVCVPCGVVSTSAQWHEGHLRGFRHRKRMMTMKRAPPPGNIHCTTCNMHVTPQAWQNHLSSPRHAQQTRSLAFISVLEEAAKDKHGVTISDEEGFDFGIVDLGIEKQIGVTIRSDVPHAKIDLVDCKLSSNQPNTPFVIQSEFAITRIAYSRPHVVVLKFLAPFRGRYEDRVEFTFEDLALQKRFAIVRDMRGIGGEQSDYEALRPTAPYVPRKWQARTQESNVIPGVKPPALDAIPWVVPLPEAAVPRALADTVSTGAIKDILSRLKNSFFPAVFDDEAYGRHWKTLLWIEEVRMENDLRIYDLDEASLSSMNQYHYLDVPGLAEKRPSVLVGDRILVRRAGMLEGSWFEGGVHVVRKAEVGMCFNASFKAHHTSATRYEVHFKLNRYPIRRQHQALDTAWAENRVLFPRQKHIHGVSRPRTRDHLLRLNNRSLTTNQRQYQAVLSILHQAPGSVPFIVFGPPGTGKTVTVIEAMLQLLQTRPQARIFACAPSNSAADIIAERLARHLHEDELFRFYAPSRAWDQVPDQIRPYTCRKFSQRGDLFSIPTMARLKRFRVIVSTCVSGSMPYGVGIPRGHFSHIFVDEAGQATEPEVMIAIKTLCDKSTNVVLSGDPKQLGPIIRSPFAQKLGLERSMLERIMDREIYQEENGYGVTMIKLVQNFRSHRYILEYPNTKFYHGDLKDCGDPKVINAYLQWPRLPKQGFPIIFHSVQGKDHREASSPSLFNIEEVLQVSDYVELLRNDRHIRITDHDIGIVAPYHAQVLKIRNKLRNIAAGVKVGSVEEFQGQERRVVIISTVRSSREFVEYDLRHTLGFVANPRRFNVAVTRARALLIVVGDPNVLGLDPLWRSFLNFVHRNGGWTGSLSRPTWDTSADVEEDRAYDKMVREAALADMNDFVRRMEAMTLSGVVDNGEADEVTVDRPWKEDE